MKAKIVSDQHLEFHAAGGSYRKYFQAIHPADGERAAICIVAGDFDVISQRSRAFFSELCNRENHVLFVPGNHEYYGCKEMTAVDEALLEIEQNMPNLTVLRTGAPFHFAERRFLGDTMWLPKSPDLILSASLVNDSRLIPHVIEEAGARHQRFRNWLSHELRVGDIVVTHHLPSERSTPDVYRASATQPWFVAGGVESLFSRKPSVWIHGHTHQRCDYWMNETRVICNPMGYPNEAGKLPGKLAPFIFEI